MSSFDTTSINVYLIGVFSVAVTGLVLALGVATTVIVRRLGLRLAVADRLAREQPPGQGSSRANVTRTAGPTVRGGGQLGP